MQAAEAAEIAARASIAHALADRRRMQEALASAKAHDKRMRADHHAGKFCAARAEEDLKAAGAALERAKAEAELRRNAEAQRAAEERLRTAAEASASAAAGEIEAIEARVAAERHAAEALRERQAAEASAAAALAERSHAEAMLLKELESQREADAAAAHMAGDNAARLRQETGEVISLNAHRMSARRWRAAAAVSIFTLTGAVGSAGVWAPAVSASASAYARRHSVPASYLFGVAAEPVPAGNGDALRGAPLRLTYDLSTVPVNVR
jgi:hypothetical protein